MNTYAYCDLFGHEYEGSDYYTVQSCARIQRASLHCLTAGNLPSFIAMKETSRTRVPMLLSGNCVGSEMRLSPG